MTAPARQAETGSGRSGLGPARKGRETRERLLGAALRVFARKGFRNVTLGDLARAARLSAGAPYQHFTGKDQMLSELAESLGPALAAAYRRHRNAAGRGAEKGAGSGLYDALLTAFRENAALLQVFREADLALGLDASRALEPLLLEIAADLGVSLDEAAGRTVAWYAFALAWFPAVMGLIWDGAAAELRPLAALELERLLREGLAGRSTRPTAPSAPPVSAAPETRAGTELPGAVSGASPGFETALAGGSSPVPARLLAAAEELFAERGYQAATLSAIARRAGVSVTAFRLHFDGKQRLLEQVVGHIRADLTRTARESAAGARGRLEVEQAVIGAFFRFLRARPGVYRVLREAEFVAPEAGRRYYLDLLGPYSEGIRRGAECGEIASLDPIVTTQALMGVGHWLGLLSVVEGRLPADETLQTARCLLRGGLTRLQNSP